MGFEKIAVLIWFKCTNIGPSIGIIIGGPKLPQNNSCHLHLP